MTPCRRGTHGGLATAAKRRGEVLVLCGTCGAAPKGRAS